MSLSRIELDGIGSPAALAKRIHELEPDLPTDFAIESVCHQLDIAGIQLTETSAFEAALVTDANKAVGSILLARASHPRRRRFSIGHELGHFLIPTHMPRAGEPFACSLDDLRLADTRDANRHRRLEAEANRFAAQLLMPPSRIRASLASRQPDLAEIVRLASAFNVSKEAMARSYIDAHRETLAVLILRHGWIDRIYRAEGFPWIEPQRGSEVPADSIARNHGFAVGAMSELEECDPETWLGERGARMAEILSEQVLGQRDGFAMVLLHAELSEDR